MFIEDSESVNPTITSENIEEVLEQIMIVYGTELTVLAYSYVRDLSTAKDIVQNVFIKCYHHLPNFKGEAALRTWIYRITINQCKDYLRSSYFRRMKFWKQEPISTYEEMALSPEDEVIQNAYNEEIRRLVLELPTKYREVLFLYYYQEYSIEEISEILEVSKNTIKTRMRRGREFLKDRLVKGGLI